MNFYTHEEISKLINTCFLTKYFDELTDYQRERNYSTNFIKRGISKVFFKKKMWYEITEEDFTKLISEETQFEIMGCGKARFNHFNALLESKNKNYRLFTMKKRGKRLFYFSKSKDTQIWEDRSTQIKSLLYRWKEECSKHFLSKEKDDFGKLKLCRTCPLEKYCIRSAPFGWTSKDISEILNILGETK